MRYAITLPNMDYDARVIADLAVDAEGAGWDGVFVWDCINMGNKSTHDPWMILAAIAARTQHIAQATLESGARDRHARSPLQWALHPARWIGRTRRWWLL